MLDAQAASLGTEAEDSTNKQLLLGCHLAVYIEEGDVQRAGSTAALVGRFPPDLTEASETLVLERAEALMLAGRDDEARRWVEGVEARWTAHDLPSVRRMHVLRALALARLATGDANAAREAATRWVRLLEGEHASASSAWREAVELLALACARAGDRATAARSLRDLATQTGVFRSAVDRAQSTLNRAEVYADLGQEVQARSLVRAALLDLTHQSADSPRLLRAKRLMSQ